MTPRMQTALGLLVGALLLAAAAGLIVAAEAGASPPPNTRHPLTWPPRTVSHMAAWWADLVTDPYEGDPIVWRTTRSSCAKPRPARWRCDIAGTLLYDGNADQTVTYRLRACRPSRLVFDDVLYKTRGAWRARVAIEQSGDRAGGLICPSVSWETTSA